MRRIVLALVVVLAVVALATPAMAWSEAMCAAISQGMEKLSGPTGGPPGNCPSPASNNPVVSTSEPLATLMVGLGLLGARLLRRR